MRHDEPSLAPSKSNPVRLRSHHLLCALTFRSRGYGQDFVIRFESFIDRIMQSSPLLLIAEPDELCQSKQNCGGCDSSVSVGRDQLALEALEALLPTMINSKIEYLTDSDLLHLRENFADGSARAACKGCNWFDICSHEAQQNFRRARLQPRSR